MATSVCLRFSEATPRTTLRPRDSVGVRQIAQAREVSGNSQEATGVSRSLMSGLVSNRLKDQRFRLVLKFHWRGSREMREGRELNMRWVWVKIQPPGNRRNFSPCFH